jgi:adenosine kinase
MTSISLAEGLLFTMGNPLLDLQVHVDADFLAKWELKKDDAILCGEKHIPMFKEITENYKVEFVAGGSTQNTARVAQWMIGCKNVTTYMGCIGNDEYGKILFDKATADGVNAVYQRHSTLKTGTCAVLLTDSNRSLCAHLAAAENFSAEHLDVPAHRDLMMKANFYYIAGFFLTTCPKALMIVAKHCAETNKVFSMNLSAAFLTTVFKAPMMDAMSYVDILFGNEDEATAFANEHKFETTSISEIALKMAALQKTNSKRARMVVITQGPKAVVVAYEGKIQEFAVEKLDQQCLVDSNGAGDAFVGGFLSRYIQKKPLSECVAAGNWASRVILQRTGCTFPAVCDYKN